MGKEINAYLHSVNKCLKPMAASKRKDILQEIESEIADPRQANLTTQGILNRLGPPKELAMVYLQDLLTKNQDIRWNRILITFAYCGLVGFSRLLVVPTLGILAPVLMICGVTCPVAGFIKLIGHIISREGSLYYVPIWKCYPLPLAGFSRIRDHRNSPVLSGKRILESAASLSANRQRGPKEDIMQLARRAKRRGGQNITFSSFYPTSFLYRLSFPFSPALS